MKHALLFALAGAALLSACTDRTVERTITTQAPDWDAAREQSYADTMYADPAPQQQVIIMPGYYGASHYATNPSAYYRDPQSAYFDTRSSAYHRQYSQEYHAEHRMTGTRHQARYAPPRPNPAAPRTYTMPRTTPAPKPTAAAPRVYSAPRYSSYSTTSPKAYSAPAPTTAPRTYTMPKTTAAPRVYSAPTLTRTYSAPARITSTPSRSYSAPSHSYSSPHVSVSSHH